MDDEAALLTYDLDHRSLRGVINFDVGTLKRDLSYIVDPAGVEQIGQAE